ncbi:L-lactate permease [Candidatus Haliotispira prima]|uniref:L-lactate permease n=1 Tax=Candidatus Haliotispira prima TaxID=3034016 RepID=A0ABY8MH46_9SPIO|nr:L-lactate permease [Candidatus Haliotispira prima]
MDNLFPASLPLVVFMAFLISKRGAIVSSIAGILTALFITYFYSADYQIDLDMVIVRDLPVVLILTLSSALVIFPGQIMNSLLKQAGIIKEIGKSIEAIKISKLKLASIIVLGMAPALESLTGFGVSLFFTVPVLMQLFSLRKALILSLLSMNIMPWGTLALATLIGSQITELSFAELSCRTSLTSFLVFPTIGFFIYFICKKDGSLQLGQVLYPIIAGLLLSSFLVFYNVYAASELAGVYSGISVAIAGFVVEFVFNRKAFSNPAYSKKATLRLFSPYIILILLIAISRIEVIHYYLHNFFIVKNGDIRFSIFTSPGFFILITIICLYIFSRTFRKGNTFFFEGIKKAFYPVTGILLFVIFARIQRSSGILKALASNGSDLSLTENIFISPLIGMISGYTTGSNVGGNVLFMSLQSEMGTYFNEKLSFAAIQNSSAGHAVFMSIPIILLTFSIAQVATKEAVIHRNWLIRRTLLYAPFLYFALTAAFYIVMRLW